MSSAARAEQGAVVNCRTVDEAVDALRKSETRWLVANGKKWGDPEAIRIARALRSNTGLRELSLAGNLIGPAGAAALGAAVGQHARLKELYLHKNKLGQKGTESFAAALQSGGGAVSLQILNLSKNGIGPRLPDNLVTPSLFTLNISNNDITELPTSLSHMPGLEVQLDGNPLASPPISLYERSGWPAIRDFLKDIEASERQSNARDGLGSVSHMERDDALLSPARRALYEGRLGEAMSLAHRANDVLGGLGLSGAAGASQAQEVARVVGLLARIDGPPDAGDCEVVAGGIPEGGVFYVSRQCLKRAPKLALLLRQPEGGGRLRAEVEGSTVLGVKCFLSYLAVEDLAVSISVCTRALEAQQGLGGAAEGGEWSGGGAVGANPAAQRGRPSRLASEAGGGDGSCNSPLTARSVDKLGYLRRKAPPASPLVGGDGEGDDLPPSFLVLAEAMRLARSLECPKLLKAGEALMWGILTPQIIVKALAASDRLFDGEVRRLCLEFLRECCAQVPSADWSLLESHTHLLQEAVVALRARGDTVGTPLDDVRDALVRSVLRQQGEMRRRVEALERVAAEASLRAERAEGQLQRALAVAGGGLGYGGGEGFGPHPRGFEVAGSPDGGLASPPPVGGGGGGGQRLSPDGGLVQQPPRSSSLEEGGSGCASPFSGLDAGGGWASKSVERLVVGGGDWVRGAPRVGSFEEEGIAAPRLNSGEVAIAAKVGGGGGKVGSEAVGLCSCGEKRSSLDTLG